MKSPQLKPGTCQLTVALAQTWKGTDTASTLRRFGTWLPKAIYMRGPTAGCFDSLQHFEVCVGSH